MSDLEAWKRNPPSIVTSDSPAAEQDRIADLFGYPPESNPQTRLIDAFHERTQRCLGGVHLTCARIEQRHREGNHSECLPVEDGQSEPCGFGVAWHKPCAQPATSPDGRCVAHAHRRCVSCQEFADRECSYAASIAVCGAYLCPRCEHAPSGHGHSPIRDEPLNDPADPVRRLAEAFDAELGPLQRAMDARAAADREPFDLETQEGRVEALEHASRLRAEGLRQVHEADRLIERCWSAAEAALSRHRSDWETT